MRYFWLHCYLCCIIDCLILWFVIALNYAWSSCNCLMIRLGNFWEVELTLRVKLRNTRLWQSCAISSSWLFYVAVAFVRITYFKNIATTWSSFGEMCSFTFESAKCHVEMSVKYLQTHLCLWERHFGEVALVLRAWKGSELPKRAGHLLQMLELARSYKRSIVSVGLIIRVIYQLHFWRA